MDVAGSAVGIVSLGIQVCQGLLSYYDAWKSYDSDISSTYEAITDLCKTLTILKTTLQKEEDEVRVSRVRTCVKDCEDALHKLNRKRYSLKNYVRPEGLRQRMRAGLQKSWYPFRKNTLDALKASVTDVQERLKLALQVLQLDIGTGSQKQVLRLLRQSTTQSAATSQIAAQNQRILAAQQSDEFRKIVAWLAPPDPGTNHATARQRHEGQTGDWLLKSSQYQGWKTGVIRHLWMHGKAGCGKTILCSTAIEDVRQACEQDPDASHAFFYFSFSDDRKQSDGDLLRSLVAQLGWREPGLSMLRRAWEDRRRNVPGPDELEAILLACIRSCSKVYLLADALDECPELNQTRQGVLTLFERLTRDATNLRVFATSRELDRIRMSMEALPAEALRVMTQAVDADIQIYVANEVSCDRTLSKLRPEMRTLIESSITSQADGMFRWAYCQLQEVKVLDSYKPKYVKEVLNSLPLTLDATYEQMLTKIKKMYHPEAITLLRWLAYARSPLTLGELCDASIIDHSQEDSIDFDERGGLCDVLNILSGLVTVVASEEGDDVETLSMTEFFQSDASISGLDLDTGGTSSHTRYAASTRVRLAHFSVKEYLESERILGSEANRFHLEGALGHHVLAQSCLTYLRYYSSSDEKTSTEQDLENFPLLRYAAESWSYHSALQHSTVKVDREASFLQLGNARADWLLVHDPEIPWRMPFHEAETTVLGPALYYASLLGLHTVVNSLLTNGSDINAQGGRYGTALQAATAEAGIETVKLLLDQGSDVNAESGQHGTALGAASWRGNTEIVKLLLDKGANIDAQGGWYDTALQIALREGNTEIAKLLLGHGANVNSNGDTYGSALQTASASGETEISQLLLDQGADVNAHSEMHGTALQAASLRGSIEIVKLLLDHGSNINAEGGQYGNALQAASRRGRVEIVKLLLDKGANVNTQSGQYDTALQAASAMGETEISQLLLDQGADVNAHSEMHGTALQAASLRGSIEIVKLLLDHGSNINAEGGQYGNALQAASRRGSIEIVKLLLDYDSNVNAKGGQYGTALQAASCQGKVKIVKLLLDKGADVNAQVGRHSTALQVASSRGNIKTMRLLLDRGANVNVHGGNQGTALHAASRRGKAETVKLLIEHGADVNATFERYGTALQAALAEGNTKAVKLLLDSGADVNVKGGKHGTALQAALWRGRVEPVKLLLDKGADIDAQVGQHSTALQSASANGNTEIARLLLDHGANVNTQGGRYNNALQAASAEGNIVIVRLLLDHGADVDTGGGEHGTALQAASTMGNKGIVLLLLDHGANVNTQGGPYNNALQAALATGNTEIALLLLDHGANINARGGRYGTALSAAAARCDTRIVQLLLDKCTDINAHRGKHGAALQAASWRGRVETVKLLLDKGANVNTQSGQYDTALQAASAIGETEIVQLLLDRGANVNTQGGVYSSALKAASSEGHREVVQMLIREGADINAQGGHYGNALQAASRSGHKDIVQILIDAGAT